MEHFAMDVNTTRRALRHMDNALLEHNSREVKIATDSLPEVDRMRTVVRVASLKAELYGKQLEDTKELLVERTKEIGQLKVEIEDLKASHKGEVGELKTMNQELKQTVKKMVPSKLASKLEALFKCA